MLIVDCKKGDLTIDYLFRLADIPYWYYLIAAAIGICVLFWKHKWHLAFLTVCLFLILTITILIRQPSEDFRYFLRPFWSYGEWKRTKNQVLVNIYMFVPVGFLAGIEWKWKAIPYSAAFSIAIELAQLLTKRGYFEFDDIIHNTLGAALGYLLIAVIWHIKRGDTGSAT